MASNGQDYRSIPTQAVALGMAGVTVGGGCQMLAVAALPKADAVLLSVRKKDPPSSERRAAGPPIGDELTALIDAGGFWCLAPEWAPCDEYAKPTRGVLLGVHDALKRLPLSGSADPPGPVRMKRIRETSPEAATSTDDPRNLPGALGDGLDRDAGENEAMKQTTALSTWVALAMREGP